LLAGRPAFDIAVRLVSFGLDVVDTASGRGPPIAAFA
jgi:hypothetical protein